MDPKYRPARRRIAQVAGRFLQVAQVHLHLFEGGRCPVFGCNRNDQVGVSAIYTVNPQTASTSRSCRAIAAQSSGIQPLWPSLSIDSRAWPSTGRSSCTLHDAARAARPCYRHPPASTCGGKPSIHASHSAADIPASAAPRRAVGYPSSSSSSAPSSSSSRARRRRTIPACSLPQRSQESIALLKLVLTSRASRISRSSKRSGSAPGRRWLSPSAVSRWHPVTLR